MLSDATPAEAQQHAASAELDVAVILVSWNTRELLLGSLAALPRALGKLRAAVWVVDNGSSDGSVAAVQARYPAVRLLVNATNVGFAAANNQPIAASVSRYVVLLNSDTAAEPESIARLVAFADEHQQAGMVGGLLLNPDGSFQASFSDFPSLHSELLSSSGLGPRLYGRWYPSYGPRASTAARQVACIPGACMLVRRAAIDAVGLMDEAYFMYSEETDWCWRMARSGWQTWYLPEARIRHYGGQSTQQVRFAMAQALYRSKVRFFQQHYGALPATTLRALLVAIDYAKWLLRRWRARRQDRTSIRPPLRWADLGSVAAEQAGRTQRSSAAMLLGSGARSEEQR